MLKQGQFGGKIGDVWSSGSAGIWTLTGRPLGEGTGSLRALWWPAGELRVEPQYPNTPSDPTELSLKQVGWRKGCWWGRISVMQDLCLCTYHHFDRKHSGHTGDISTEGGGRGLGDANVACLGRSLRVEYSLEVVTTQHTGVRETLNLCQLSGCLKTTFLQTFSPPSLLRHTLCHLYVYAALHPLALGF